VDRVHYILDEIVMGGSEWMILFVKRGLVYITLSLDTVVLETSVGEVMEAVSEMNKLENTTRALGVKA